MTAALGAKPRANPTETRATAVKTGKEPGSDQGFLENPQTPRGLHSPLSRDKAPWGLSCHIVKTQYTFNHLHSKVTINLPTAHQSCCFGGAGGKGKRVRQ